MEKVYTLTSVWKNGEKFEGEISTKVYADKDMAIKILNEKAKEAKYYLLKTYDEEDIHVEGNQGITNTSIIVDANEYADYWEGWVEEQDVIGNPPKHSVVTLEECLCGENDKGLEAQWAATL